MKKSKNQQTKLRNLGNVSTILSEFERIITVVFHAELADRGKCSDELDLIAHVKLHHHSAEVRLHDTLAKCVRENETFICKELTEKRLVLDFETLRDLFRSDVASFVELYLLPSSAPATEVEIADKNDTIRVGRGLVHPPDRRKNLVAGKKEAALAVDLAKSNAEGAYQKPSSRANSSIQADRIFSIPIYLEDIMRSRSQTYPAEVSRLGFLKRCWVEVRVRDDCLIPDPLFGKCRPVSVRVCGVQQLQKLLVRERKQKYFRVAVQFASHTLLSPYHSATDESECMDILRGVLLLGDQTPLEVYQAVMLSSVKVCLSLLDEMLISELCSPSNEESTLEGLMDVGVFGVQEFATDGQTYFDTDVQLLPSRKSFTFHAENCLTTACAVRLKLNFFAPLPILQHVNERGDIVTRQFLSRSMIMVPYSLPCLATFLDTMVRELLNSKRARRQDNITLYQPPPLFPDLPPEPEETKTEATRAPKGVSTTNHKAQSILEAADKFSVPPPQVISSLSRPTRFEQPFQVITPMGISGFEVADGEVHFICLEGPIGELHRIMRALFAALEKSTDVKFWMNSELFVPMRYYNHFPPLVTRPGKQTDQYADTETSSPPVSPSTGNEKSFAIADLEVDEAGGGCGGRIHRIRLNKSLLSLAADPHHLLRHTLSQDCLRCVHMLYELRQCHTLRAAFERRLFPTAESLIALERTFGKMLSLVDIFGRDKYKSSTHAPFSLAQESLQSKPVNSLSSASEVNIAELGEKDIGRLTFFQGIRVENRGRKIPHRLLERFHNALWMQTDRGEQVLCAFQNEIPSSTIRYHIDGQIVRFENTYLLHVLAHHSLAKSMTDSKNSAFETILRERNRRERKQQLDLTRSSKKQHKSSQKCLLFEHGSGKTRRTMNIQNGSDDGGGKILSLSFLARSNAAESFSLPSL